MVRVRSTSWHFRFPFQMSLMVLFTPLSSRLSPIRWDARVGKKTYQPQRQLTTIILLATSNAIQ
jgi:hypothetical protein